jgi:subtilisin family serine protease
VRRLTWLAAAVFALALPALAVAGSRGTTDGGATAPGVDTSSAIVQLKGDPLSTDPATAPAPGKKIDFNSDNVKSYRAQLSAERNDFKQWLKQYAPAANVTGQFDIGLNAVSVDLNGTSLDLIKTAPMVQDAQYEQLFTPQADPDLPLISAFDAWNSPFASGGGGGANAGKMADGTRVKIAMIDTGIDINSPCFNDSGYSYPPGFPKGDTTYTNKKVIVARVFNNRAKRQGLTAAPVQAHGTHTAGTAACDYGLTNSATTVDGTPVNYGVLGVAPAAQLGNYNVFPGNVTNARSEDIFDALESAYADGMDIASMSLGGTDKYGVQDLLIAEVNHLDRANMVVAVAAGNSGPNPFTIQSPGAAAGALTAGAASVGHFIGIPVTPAGLGSFGAAVGQFTNFGVVTSQAYTTTTPANGCTTISTALTGKIALIDRGTCSFSTKIRNAQAAGANGVLIANNVAGDPTAMAQDGTPNQPTIPAVMVSMTNGAAMKADSTKTVSVDGTVANYFQTGNNDILASFSSRGPTTDDFRVKPDVIAPGVNVLSSIPSSGPESCAVAPCWAFFQGTSMATPHLSGSAAVVLAQHPTWASWEIRSAIVNTADQNVVRGTSTGACCVSDANSIGAGRENLNAAVNAAVALDPVSVSFGAVPSGSGQTKSIGVTLANLTGSTLVVPAPSVVGTTGTGVSYSASASALSIPANGTATLTVTMNAAKNAGLGGHQAILKIGSLAHAAVFTFIK